MLEGAGLLQRIVLLSSLEGLRIRPMVHQTYKLGTWMFLQETAVLFYLYLIQLNRLEMAGVCMNHSMEDLPLSIM